MKRTASILLLLGAPFLLSGCSVGPYAPVLDIGMLEPVSRTNIHIVEPHETIYSISWRYGLDFRMIANINHISPPYNLHVGQKLYLLPTQEMANRPPEPAPVEPRQSVKANHQQQRFIWPAKGKVVQQFGRLNKGVNIAGTAGEPILAIAKGRVVYSGNGLRGYGNLIILKHDETYLSAYAHNRRILVKEGQMVVQGQQIAEMGHTGTNRIMLHFEIRRAGQPIDPIAFYR